MVSFFLHGKVILLYIFKRFIWLNFFSVTGIFTRGQLGLAEIIFQYIHCDEIYEAINILSSMNWDTLGHQCFISMSAIVNHLLRQKLTPEREGETWNIFQKCVLHVHEVHFIVSYFLRMFLSYWRLKDKNGNALLKLTISNIK